MEQGVLAGAFVAFIVVATIALCASFDRSFVLAPAGTLILILVVLPFIGIPLLHPRPHPLHFDTGELIGLAVVLGVGALYGLRVAVRRLRM